ncbi:MAG TPA: MlaD family protein [Clostridia bacterium]|nr:MlaD family protein [Clostridia bacterium]
MSKSSFEWKVGLFVLISLIVAGALLLQFSKGVTLFRSTYQIFLDAPNVGGLKRNAAVLMSGVQVGTVSDIRLTPSGRNVVITLRIFSDYQIHKDARFVIDQSGFLGDTYVAIVPTKNELPVFVDNDEEHAKAQEPFNFLEFTRNASGFIERLDETAKKLNEALEDVRQVALNPQTLTNLAVTVGNLREFSERALATVDNVQGLVASNGPALTLSSSNLVAFSYQLNEFADGLNGVLATNTPEINAVIKNVGSSSETLNSLLQDVKSGKGLAGELIRNEQVANDVARIAQNLSVTSSNLNRLGLWGIMWQRKPARQSAGPPPEPIRSPKDQP